MNPLLEDLAQIRDLLQPHCDRLRVRAEEPDPDLIQVDAQIKVLEGGAPHPQFGVEIQRFKRLDGSLADGRIEIVLPSGRHVIICFRASNDVATPAQAPRTPTAAEIETSLKAVIPVAHYRPPAAVGHLANRQVEEFSTPNLL